MLFLVVVSIVLHHDALQSLLFAVALAVGGDERDAVVADRLQVRPDTLGDLGGAIGAAMQVDTAETTPA